MHDEKILEHLDELERQAQGLVSGLAALRAVVEGKQPGLPAAERGLLERVGDAVKQGRRRDELPSAPTHVEGELADEEHEGEAARPAAAARPSAELPASSGPSRRPHLTVRSVSHRLHPFAGVYVGFAVTVAALIAASEWPRDDVAIVIGLWVAVALVALTAVEPLHRLVWREVEHEEMAALPQSSGQRRGQRRKSSWPLRLLALAALLVVGAAVAPWDAVALAAYLLTVAVALVALIMIIGDWARQLRAQRRP